MPITKKELQDKFTAIPDAVYELIDARLEREWNGRNAVYVTEWDMKGVTNKTQIDEIVRVYRAAGWAVNFERKSENGRTWNELQFS